MPRGHVELNGQAYIVQDESLVSKVVPMFRPQLVVEGISREAQDQYLFMAWDTWDRGSYYQARTTGRWINGGFGLIDGIDNSIENALQLQRVTKLSLSRPFVSSLPNVTRLVSVGGWLLAFSENGEVWRRGGASLVKLDNFDRTNSNSLGALWTEDESVATNLAIVSNLLHMDITNVQDAFARRTETYGNDQYAQMKWVSGTGATQSGVMVRSSGPRTNFTGYVATWWTNNPGNSITLRRYVNTADILDTTGVLIGTFTYNPVSGDTLKLEAIGSAIKVYVNSILRISVTDANIASGKPGVLVHSSAASVADWDDFEADATPAVEWETVTYDFATYGGVSFVDVATTSGGGSLSGTPGSTFESIPRLLIGTLTGKVFLADIGLNATTGVPEVRPVNVFVAFADKRIRAALAYRNNIAIAVENRLMIRAVDQNGVFVPGDSLSAVLPGSAIALAVWNQLIMVGVQASTRGSVIVAASASQAIDTYRVDGGFTIQSMVTWGGQLVYGGKAFRSSEVYSFPGTRSDMLPPGPTPTDVLALYATHRHVMAGWNGHNGVWWMHDKGTGALVQYDAPNSTATDDWNRADNLALGASWTEQESTTTDIQINSNQLRFLFGNGAARRTGTWLKNQLSKMKFVSGTGDGGGPAVRVLLHGGGLISCYAARVNSVAGTIELVRYFNEASSSAGTVLQSTSRAVAANDTIEIRADEHALTVTHNGLAVLAATDTLLGGHILIVGGAPGVFGRGVSGEQRWDDWEAQDFADGTYRRVRSIVVHQGEVFYSLDHVGVIRADMKEYRSSGEITSGWFDGGFPELQKNFADVFVRLKRPRTATETFTVSARVDGKSEVAVGSVAQGRIDSTFPLPASLQQGKRINLRLTIGNTASPATTTPVITACVLRYRPIPIQQRVWGFTVKAAENLLFLDGSREKRTPATILADLFALPNVGQIEFSSVLEPTSRKVYVTNVELKDQLLGRSRPGESEESHIAVEILEASAVLDNAVVSNPPQLNTEGLPLEDPDYGPGDDRPTPGVGSGPPNAPEDRPFEFPFLQ